MAIALDSKQEKAVRAFAKGRGLEPRAALDRLIGTAFGRLAALDKYQKSPKGKRAAKKSASKGKGKGKKVTKLKKAA